MARNRGDKLGTLSTSVRTEGGWTHVRYHSTDVVSFNASTIILRTGGWNTPTTRRRMNQAAKQFGLGYGVSSIKGVLCANYGAWHPFNGNECVINRKEVKS